MKTVDFSETIAASDLKVDRCRQLIEFLAHLSQRLIGELIVYEGIRRPSLRRPSVVRQHFQTTSSLKP